jgi:glycosyltransferase involved in cell wall biosynthesis
MRPYFSIIIPTFNRAHFIDKCLNSIQNQTFENWETIIIDDGSTDDTKSKVAQFAENDERIKYFYQSNKERSEARNNGINKAYGKYVCFIDSDDKFDESHLQNLYNKSKNVENSSHFFITNARIQNKEGLEILKKKVIIYNNRLETILLNSITPGQLCIPNKLIKDNLFNTEIRISEDTDLLIRLAKNNTFEVLPYHTHIYIQHEENSVNPEKFNAYKERLNTLKYILKMDICEDIDKKLKRKILSDCYFGISKYYLAQGRTLKSKLILLQALLMYPEVRWKEKLYLIFKK